MRRVTATTTFLLWFPTRTCPDIGATSERTAPSEVSAWPKTFLSGRMTSSNRDWPSCVPSPLQWSERDGCFMRPDLLAEVRDWVQRAVEDLREAEHDLTAEPPPLRGAVFHCQQAAEKALKAFLTAHEEPFRKIHDLDECGTCSRDSILRSTALP